MTLNEHGPRPLMQAGPRPTDIQSATPREGSTERQRTGIFPPDVTTGAMPGDPTNAVVGGWQLTVSRSVSERRHPGQKWLKPIPVVDL